MSRQVLFIQGGGENVHDAWDDKLVASLGRELGRPYEIIYPRMPNEDEPDYPRWKAAIGREMAKLDDGAILIGHSIGGTMLIHALADEPPKMRPGAVLLISAPFVGEGGWPSDDIAAKRDIGVRLAAGIPVHVFHGSEDEIAPPPHADLYGQAIRQARVHRLPGRDHQLNNNLSEVAEVVRQLEWASAGVIRAAWSGFFIALGAAVALLYFDAPASFVNVALGLAFACAAPICFNAFRDVARLFQH